LASRKNKPHDAEKKPEAVNEAAEEQATEEQTPETVTMTKEELETVKKHIDELQKKLDDTIALLQRNQADFDNYRKRNATVRADSYDEGKRDCIKALLPVLDDFDRVAESDPGADGWADGVKLVHKKFAEILKKEGLEEIPSDGAFDPELHNAVMTEAVEGLESGNIVQTFQKGYKVKEKIIRHSMVKVSE
jgi:molecular chaperone GrpE